jgi:hypothetical protein
MAFMCVCVWCCAEGATAVVYAATDLQDERQRQVALKVRRQMYAGTRATACSNLAPPAMCLFM